MNLEVLEKIGLTKSEIKVYLALLELGSTTTGPIVDKSRASSSKIYEILERLIQKGLVSYVMKGNTKYFEAAFPDRILDYINEKESELTKQRKEVEKLLPQLVMRKEMSKYKQEATIYRGMRGLETAFYDALKPDRKDETWRVFGVPERSEKVNYFFVRWNKDRADKGIKMKILFDESARGELQTLPENNPLSEIKYMPKELSMPAAVNIFGDKTIIFPSETEKQPLIIVIDNKEVADSFKTQFDILWNQQTWVYTGIKGPKMILKDMAENAKEIFAFGLEESKLQEKTPEELKEFNAAVERRKIPERLLFKKGSKIKLISKYAEVRFLPPEYFGPLHVEIYGNKVAISDWTKPITTIVFEKKAIADEYRRYFELLWNMGKPKK
ncbi:hypothetical protein AYK26_07405 [Euryarchaeota archaeon SM23-78]|nr:MAG: hypothetical protein AYK26_07405 [Euryarchaeota archaeon SM23-78]MBW3001286.1 hypothetical protein [Candidatus Woesearchaeota archaeon]